MFRSLDIIAAIAGVALVVGVVILARRAGVTAASFNPASQDNLANRAANAGVAAITGDPNQTVGGAVFDWLNPNAGLAKGETSPAQGVIQSAVTPLPAAGMGDDYGWWFGGGGYVESPSGAAIARPFLKF